MHTLAHACKCLHSADNEYSVSGYAVINGQQRELANTATFVQPPINAPVLTQANEVDSTSATATAEPPNGVTYSRVSAKRPIWA